MPRSCSAQCTTIDESNAQATGDISPSHSAESIDGPQCSYFYSPKTDYSFSDEDPAYKYFVDGSPPMKPKDSDEEVVDDRAYWLKGDVIFKTCALDLSSFCNKKKMEEEEEEPRGAKKKKNARAGRGPKKDITKKKKKNKKVTTVGGRSKKIF